MFIREEKLALKSVNGRRPTCVELSDSVGCNYYEADTLYSHHPSATLLTWPKCIKGCVFVQGTRFDIILHYITLKYK